MLIVSIRESVIGAGGTLIGCGLLFASWAMSRSARTDDTTVGLVLMLGVVAVIAGSVGALLLASMHALVAPITAIEGVGAIQAARRSRQLMKNRQYHGRGYDRVWSLYMLLGFIALVMMLGSRVLWELAGADKWADQLELQAFKPVVDTFLALAPPYMALLVTIPVWAVTVTIIYFERRVRLEGYDIEALAADVWTTDRTDGVRVHPAS
jgi:hypothetical protein